MVGEKKGHDYGPSWGDFCNELTHFVSAHEKMALVEIARTPRADGACCLYFRVVCFTSWDKGFRVGERGEGHSWPANEWTTVPAMLFALLHRLDHRLEEERLVAEQQAMF